MQKYVPFLLLLWMLWLLPRGSSLNAEPRPAGRTTQAGEGGDSAPGEAQMVPSNRQDEVPLADDAGHPREGEAHEWNPPLLAVLPFLLMLLSIAIIPLVNHEWWENDKHRGMVSALLGIPALLFVYLSAANAAEEIDRTHRILHVGEEYVSFIILLGSLFVISGGIVITGNLKGTPVVNTAFLAVGGLLASFIGTTGAAMLLIRPLLTTNSERHHTLHTVIFFIFIVCNCGGCLTPLGDPPLFLGYLKGVPFDWTFDLIGAWTFVVGCLLAIYLALDWIQHRKEKPRDIRLDERHEKPLVIRGAHNFLFLGGVVFAVAKVEWFSFPSREGVMILMAAAGLLTTRSQYRKTNRFTFGPIIEVAVVFSGIFSTMIPALALLEARGDSMGISISRQFFWATGSLSSFLDNAPTYVSFLALANGIAEWPAQYGSDALAFTKGLPAHFGSLGECKTLAMQWAAEGKDAFAIPQLILRAISLGAVFMGAMTYIGNGPNFMVRAIADESGVRMPSFFGYLLWSVLFLVPVFFLATLLFL